MTTDNTQAKLYQILDNLGERHIMAEHGLIGSKDAETERAARRILDWHNKQTLELLDRLEAEGQIVDTRLYKREIVATPHSVIEAERNRLKGASNDK